jgi:hypothetical protein
MKVNILLIAVALGISACTTIATEELPTPTAPELTLAEKAKKYAEEHPDIQTPVIVSKLPKSVKVALGSTSIGNYNFEYNSQEQLVRISMEKSPVFEITLDLPARKANSTFAKQEMAFLLNQEGLAESSDGILNNGNKVRNQYFYKNGYLVGMSDDFYLTKLKYNTNGNLLEWNGVTHQREKVLISYEYTDYPNIIHQEITSWITPHFTYRGGFLGKYSSNLLKRAVIAQGSSNTYTLDFSYTFDAGGRLSTMLIKRVSEGDVLYEYHY